MVPTELAVTEDMGVGEDSARVGISATAGFSSEVADSEANTISTVSHRTSCPVDSVSTRRSVMCIWGCSST